MPTLKNFVAIDWRAGPDRIYFFFKDTDTYSRFDIGDNKVPEGYPASVKGNWDSFDRHVKDLRFGFTTTLSGDQDVSWLFYYDGSTPMVCKYDQDLDKVAGTYKVANSIWAPLLPYFDNIIAGTWWESTGHRTLCRFLLNDGSYLSLNYINGELNHRSITYMRGLAPYKDRMITAAQNDQPLLNTYWYIFLTNNQFLIYDIRSGEVVGGLRNVNNTNWPGLLRG